jgi:hypothetical protein
MALQRFEFAAVVQEDEVGLSGSGAQFGADHICDPAVPKKSQAHKPKSATRNPA